MKKRTLTIILIVFFAQISTTIAMPSFKDLWQKGDAFYQQKEYDSALAYFGQIAAAKPADPTIYYNLGNTYYRLNEIGESVLSYERALKRNPDYKEAADNLLLAQNRIPGRLLPSADIFFVKWYKAATAGPLAKIWAVLSLLLFILTLAVLLYRRLRPDAGWLRPQVVGFLIVCWLICLIISFISANAAREIARAVIMESETPFYLQQTATGKAQSLLPEGTTVKLENQTGKWLNVTLPDGREGWISSGRAALVD